MNKRQVVALWVGMGLIVLMGLFPPWVKTDTIVVLTPYVHVESACGYYPLFAPPKANLPQTFKVDMTRLGIQFVLVALVTGGAILTLRTPRRAGLMGTPVDPGKEKGR